MQRLSEKQLQRIGDMDIRHVEASLHGATHLPPTSEPQILRHSWGVFGVLSAILAYLAFLLSAFGGAFNPVVALLICIYIPASIVATALIFAHDRNLLRQTLRFRRVSPFAGYGIVVDQFQYVFSARDPVVLREVIETINRDITGNLKWEPFETVKLADHDRRLLESDARSFLAWRSGKSKRGGSIYLMARASQKGSVCSLQWWVIVSGVIDRGVVRSFIAWAPLSLPFWIVPWLRGDHNIAAGLRETYGSFYEQIDMVTGVKSVLKISFDALIEALRRHGIETADLGTLALNQINNYTSNVNINSGTVVGSLVNAASGGAGPAIASGRGSGR